MTATVVHQGFQNYLRQIDRDLLAVEQECEFDWRTIRQNDPQARDPMTLHEIGRFIGVTRQRIRQIETKALRTLRVRFRPCDGGPPVPAVRRILGNPTR